MNASTVPDANRTPLSLELAMARMNLTEAPQPLSDVLDRVVTNRGVLQDFTRLDECLESALSNRSWQVAGLDLFTGNDVPYAINNTSQLSDQAAQVLLRNCMEFEPAARVVVVEFGAGTGLFARYFLDAFRLLCEGAQRDFHERLTFFVTDGSRRTVEQWSERGLFAEHAAHVVMGTCNAVEATHVTTLDGTRVELPSLRGVFCNYLFDTLPSTVVRRGSEGCEELFVRTRLTDDMDRLKRHTRRTPDELRAMAREVAASEAAPHVALELAALVSCFDYETAFRPLGRTITGADEAMVLGQGLDRVLLNHGALDCVSACVPRLETGGFLLVNDYGPVQTDQIAAQSVSQRFGRTLAIGVNFPLLQHHASSLGCTVIKPDDDDARSIHTRLIATSRMPGTFETFNEQFGLQAQLAEKLPEEARRHMEAGRQDEAIACYRRAMAHHPRDWRLLGEVAEFLIRSLSDYEAGLAAGRSAVAINPWYSPWLWNVVGDALYAMNAFEQAHEAYLQGQRIDPADVRTNLNLAYTYCAFAQYGEALDAIARGLASDTGGIFRDRLLEKQGSILALKDACTAAEGEWLNRRAARLRS